jgi:hypothetical protein
VVSIQAARVSLSKDVTGYGHHQQSHANGLRCHRPYLSHTSAPICIAFSCVHEVLTGAQLGERWAVSNELRVTCTRVCADGGRSCREAARRAPAYPPPVQVLVRQWLFCTSAPRHITFCCVHQMPTGPQLDKSRVTCTRSCADDRRSCREAARRASAHSPPVHNWERVKSDLYTHLR